MPIKRTLALPDPSTSRGMTATGHRMGTIDYMSPEQIEGEKLDHRSDIYSLGCLLYALMTGGRPFAGESDASVIREKMRGPSTPSLASLGFPRALDQAVRRAQEERPEDRFSSAGEFALAASEALGVPRPAVGSTVALGQATDTQPLAAPIDGAEPQSRRWCWAIHAGHRRRVGAAGRVLRLWCCSASWPLAAAPRQSSPLGTPALLGRRPRRAASMTRGTITVIQWRTKPRQAVSQLPTRSPRALRSSALPCRHPEGLDRRIARRGELRSFYEPVA